MLFSPPNEFGKQPFYKLFGYSFAVHSLLLVLIFGTEVWLSMSPTVVSLRKPGKVSMPGRRGKRSGIPKSLQQGSASQNSSSQAQALPSPGVDSQPSSSSTLAQTPLAAEEPKKVPKKIVPDKKQSEKPASDKSVPDKSVAEKKEKKAIPPAPTAKDIKNIPAKPVAEKKALETKKETVKKAEEKKEVKPVPQPSTKETVKQEQIKKDSAQKEVKQQPEKASAQPASKEVQREQAPVTNAPLSQSGSLKNSGAQTGTQPASSKGVGASLPGAIQDDGDGYEDGDGEEVSAADAALSEDVIQQEFGRNFTIPDGFEDYDTFTISFDIKDGKVINVSPHTKGALVVYTAVKDALLKSRMPMRNRKNIVWVIT